MKKGVYGILNNLPGLEVIVLEGGGSIAEIWQREAHRRTIRVLQIGAEQWREALLFVRERRTGRQAKSNAELLAGKIIQWSGAPNPTSLDHNTAEAILVGYWGALEEGLIMETKSGFRS